jgi:hypothetical protein
MNTSEPFDTVVEGRRAYDNLMAATQRSLRVFDQDLSELALDAQPRIDALRRLCLSGSNPRIEILLRDWAPVRDRQPGLMDLLRNFGHIIEIRQEEPMGDPPMESFCIGDDRMLLIRPHRENWRGHLHRDDPLGCRVHLATFSQLWQRSEGPLASRPLGL